MLGIINFIFFWVLILLYSLNEHWAFFFFFLVSTCYLGSVLLRLSFKIVTKGLKLRRAPCLFLQLFLCLAPFFSISASQITLNSPKVTSVVSSAHKDSQALFALHSFASKSRRFFQTESFVNGRVIFICFPFLGRTTQHCLLYNVWK